MVDLEYEKLRTRRRLLLSLLKDDGWNGLTLIVEAINNEYMNNKLIDKFTSFRSKTASSSLKLPLLNTSFYNSF
jgi:hypothetical protein